MKYTFIITAWKEPITVRDNLHRLLASLHGNYLPSMEIILACPDDETYFAAKEVIDTYAFKNFIRIQDPQKGKPTALNLAFKSAHGEILICTDGDVLLADNALPTLVQSFKDQKVGIVTGRPVSADTKKTMFGYFGNLLADVAHVKRAKEFDRGGYYFVSGYLYAMRSISGFQVPNDTLVDDAWITLQYVLKGMRVAYAPEAKVYVKYPKNMNEWIKQKRRSMGGYSQLNDLNAQLPSHQQRVRSIREELKFFLFPIKYARNLREFFYSLMLYPSRLWLWFAIWWSRYGKKMTFEKTWSRIESTK